MLVALWRLKLRADPEIRRQNSWPKICGEKISAHLPSVYTLPKTATPLRKKFVGGIGSGWPAERGPPHPLALASPVSAAARVKRAAWAAPALYTRSVAARCAARGAGGACTEARPFRC